MLSSLPCFYALCWSATPTSHYIFYAFYSCSCHFFLAADACLSKVCHLSITEQKVCPHRLPMHYWLKKHCPDQALFKHTLYTNCISNLHAYTWSKNGIIKETIVLRWPVRSTSWDFKPGKSNGLVHCSVENAAVLCENHHERVTQIWTSPSEEEEERETIWPSGNFLVWYFCDAF